MHLQLTEKENLKSNANQDGGEETVFSLAGLAKWKAKMDVGKGV